MPAHSPLPSAAFVIDSRRAARGRGSADTLGYYLDIEHFASFFPFGSSASTPERNELARMIYGQKHSETRTHTAAAEQRCV